jgi:hypothetical protein
MSENQTLTNKEIESEEALQKILSTLPIKDDDRRNTIICSLIGHSNICSTCFGYRYCGRCSAQLGDSLGSIDFGASEAVIIGHKCDKCKANYELCTWKDKLYVKDPFEEEKSV